MAVRRGTFFTGMLAATVLAGGSAVPSRADPFKFPDAQLEPATWSDLNGWASDDHIAAFTAFLTSCQPFLKESRPRDAAAGEPGAVGSLPARREPQAATAAEARAFFEENFRPVRITKLGDAEGFLTGYYEPIVQGSRFPNPEFSVPLYRRPRDLEAAGYKPGSSSFPNSKTVPIGRRNDKGELVPYPDRGEIEAGALDGQHLEICWVRDWFEALTIQIQGSARVMLEDGLMVRINYDSFNGHPYSSIGRVLIERNEIPREEMSMQRIKDWMKVNPNKAAEVRRHQSLVRVLPHHRPRQGRRAGRRAERAADAGPLDRGRQDPRLRHADLYRGDAADRQRAPGDAVPPADDRAGHRLRHRRAGARRSLLGRGRRFGAHRRAHPPSRPLRDAAAARARHDRGRPRRCRCRSSKPANIVEEAKKDAAAEAKKKEAGTAVEPNKPDTGAKKPARPARGQAIPGSPAVRHMTAEGRRPGRRNLSDDERTLWREVTRSVRPLRRAQGRSPARREAEVAAPTLLRSRSPKHRRAPLPSRPAAAPEAKPAPGLAPIERRQKKRLARGTEPIDARLDLHGCTQSEAHAALLQFLRRAQGNGARYVLVITGKGRAGSDGFREAGVLKRQVPLWLAMPEFRGYVVGFDDAAASHGGEGALYVRLRRGRLILSRCANCCRVALLPTPCRRGGEGGSRNSERAITALRYRSPASAEGTLWRGPVKF